MSDTVKLLVTFIAQHAEWAFPIMFITAFGESFVFLSLLFPGTALMVAAGLLVPDGTLPLFPLLAGSILGAVLGDSVSWQLGRRYGHLLDNRWPFTRRPDLMIRGTAFFQKYGLASVFIGRFLGPLRATVPLVAGIAKMRPLPFWIANIASALIWAPAVMFLGSGIVLFARYLPVSGPWKIAIGAALLAGTGILSWLAHRMWSRRAEVE
jgi:membrane protein DedA with SNARE-associated domain